MANTGATRIAFEGDGIIHPGRRERSGGSDPGSQDVKRRAWLILAVVGLGIVSPWRFVAGADPSARELLEHYSLFVDGLETIEFRLRETTSAKGGAFSDWTWMNLIDATFVKSGARWRCRSRGIGHGILSNTNYLGQAESEATFDGRTYIQVERIDRTTENWTDLSEAAAEQLMRSGMGDRVDTTASAEVDADRPVMSDFYKKQNQSCALYGYIPSDDLTVIDLLRDSATRLTTQADVLSGRRCRVLEGVTAYGVVTLWLDPAASFAPVRLRIVKGEADLIGKVRMRTLEAPGYAAGPYPNLPMRGMEMQIDYRLDTVAGRPMIVSYTRLDRFIYEGGSDYQRRDEAALSEIRFDPAPGALEPTLAIPDETQVVIRNSLGLRAKWSDGKLIMDYDEPTVARLDGKWQSDTSNNSPWGRPLILAAAATLALSLTCLAWASWRRRR